ncbi:Lrp/AsnC family transcriptional regulator [Wenyingzhuangia marina]|uniref:Lrp/AsnC family transcriptional regulator, leucine-responsive regulatory protein n=1 Tax=Wenyingzhuangia marina TaxID=1195760 RepID=A0A1M5STG4_9FLAO|nr:Lrp/AsnC family transcriptional regulator [Wenyingzhuangia marina]GGF63681.1 AsnC family transcriptional regulator [Wenyingzhuangia marina]SHH41273.1 Lrp/AsnC family transcriptional regulator, leucine-responsive regulatory protein [Wenyingzhuangia marina]
MYIPDKTDLTLLKQLQKNARITIKELANITNLSNTPVHERIKKLEKNGYITKHVALLDRTLLGKKLIVFCNIKLKEHTMEIGNQFVKDITALKQVTECYNISGDYDFLLKVMVNDMEGYQNFVLNHLGNVKNIGSTQSTFVMGEIKNSTEIPI